MNQRTPEEVKNLEAMSIQIHDALISKPIDEEAIINILSSTSNLDRQIIRFFYKKKFLNPIQSDIKSHLSKELRDLVFNMFDLPYEYDARELHTAIASINRDDKTLIEIITTRPRSHLILVQKIYKKFYNTSLKDDLLNLDDKNFAQFLLTILSSKRPKEKTLEINDAYNIAKDLDKNGIKEYGIKVDLFKEIFVDKSREDLILISRAYYNLYKKNLYNAIDNEIFGLNKILIKNILFGIITPDEYFAKKIYKAMKGVGNDIRTIFRVIISRAEIDLNEIKDCYFRDRNTDLINDINSECPGAYGKILVNLFGK